MKHNHYGILPANVRTSNLTAGAKLLYAELTAQPNNGTYTEVTNPELAKALNVDKGTISRWLSELNDAGFIMLIVFAEQGNKRHIYPMHGLKMANVIGSIMQAFTNIQ